MPRLKHRLYIFLLLIPFLWLTVSCRSPQIGEEIQITIDDGGNTQTASVASGSTVTQALQDAGIAPGPLDRTDPPFYTVLSEGDTITLTRVEEVFETEEVTIPFEKQVVRNETIPEGETRLVQAGVNGLQEITYRRIIENGVEVSKSSVKTIVLSESLPEIIMVGAQTSFTPLNIPGTLAYLAGGNAWIMEGSTANRRVIVSTGDLDGRIFTLSPNGEYLVFTRKSTKPADEEINTLWAVRTKNLDPKPFSLRGKNVVHYAEWIPNSNSVAFSTVEPRSAAPGWQANNDLYRVSISSGEPRRLLRESSGGVYGWWGISFTYSPSGVLAYASPDTIGLVDQDKGYLKPLLEITPLNTHSDWAWIPPIAWGADGKSLYFVNHAPAPAPITSEESPFFDLTAASLESASTVNMVNSTGMFAYPSTSPLQSNGTESSFQVAYLQSIFTEQSDTSRYRLNVMDRDGSNNRTLFPPADLNGIEPQVPIWAPGSIEGQGGNFIAVVYQGNIWFVDSGNASTYQITGDGLINEIDWN